MLFQPIRPMLGYMADLSNLNAEGKLLESKVDGIRVQVHKQDDMVRIFSRTLRDMTEYFPDVIKCVNDQIKGDCILDGELIGKNFRNVRQNSKLRLFDILFAEADVREQPLYKRKQILAERFNFFSDKCCLVEQFIPKTLEDVKKFYVFSMSQGNEGIMIKSLNAPYFSGRTFDMLKLKPKVTLDLVVTEALYGKGFYSNVLSQFVVACKDDNKLTNFGKVYAGLNFFERKELNKKLEEIATTKESNKIFVKPEIVLEIICSGFEPSEKYGVGFIPRNATIARIRWDKTAEEIDTKERLMEYAKWFSV